MRPTLAAALILLAVAGSARAGEGDRVPFIAHRAIYDLTLDKSTGDKAPTGARGRIVYEFTGSACEGYVTTFRQVVDLQPADGGSRVSDMRSTTFEDGAAKTFRFKIETSMDESPQDNVDGTATRTASGGLAVALTSPKPDKLELESAVALPTQHLEEIIAAARDGKNTFTTQAYDGSEDGEKIFDTFTVIGAAAPTPAGEPAAQNDALKSTRRWPVAISYFDTGKTDAAPSYVLAFDLYENGVSGSLKLDYGDFVLAGKLVKFEPLPQAPCTK